MQEVEVSASGIWGVREFRDLVFRDLGPRVGFSFGGLLVETFRGSVSRS